MEELPESLHRGEPVLATKERVVAFTGSHWLPVPGNLEQAGEGNTISWDERLENSVSNTQV